MMLQPGNPHLEQLLKGVQRKWLTEPSASIGEAEATGGNDRWTRARRG